MITASPASRVHNIRHSLVALNMQGALEMLDATLRRIEQGQIEAVDELFIQSCSSTRTAGLRPHTI
jgi:hypothetical protein